MTRWRYRFRRYTLSADPLALVTLEAFCVSGDEVECGAVPGERFDVVGLDRWIARHVAETGHERYRRTVAQYALAEPGEWQ